MPHSRAATVPRPSGERRATPTASADDRVDLCERLARWRERVVPDTRPALRRAGGRHAPIQLGAIACATPTPRPAPRRHAATVPHAQPRTTPSYTTPVQSAVESTLAGASPRSARA